MTTELGISTIAYGNASVPPLHRDLFALAASTALPLAPF